MTNLVGTTLLKRYFLRSNLGSGGMADVYLAWDNLRSAQMALKVLRRDLVVSKEFYRRFAREAELLRKLEHPNIARLYEFERSGDIVFLVMEWIEGSSLRDVIHEEKVVFTTDKVAQLLLPLSAALFYAHQKNIFHCDVKPANIMLQKNERIFLTDFGMARFAMENLSGGTPPYMSPEQITGGKIDARTDIYAMGITLYEMLSGGYAPFRGEHANSKGSTLKDRIAWEHLNLSIPPLKQFNVSINSDIKVYLFWVI